MSEHMVKDCPCKVACKRHGNCAECISYHRAKGWPLVACMQELLDRRRKGPRERFLLVSE